MKDIYVQYKQKTTKGEVCGETKYVTDEEFTEADLSLWICVLIYRWYWLNTNGSPKVDLKRKIDLKLDILDYNSRKGCLKRNLVFKIARDYEAGYKIRNFDVRFTIKEELTNQIFGQKSHISFNSKKLFDTIEHQYIKEVKHWNAEISHWFRN